MSFFKVKSVKKVEDLQVGDRVEESDFAAISGGDKFIQFEWIEDEDIEKTKVGPGLFTLQKTSSGLKLEKTSFTKTSILTNNNLVKTITDQIRKFFDKKDVYLKYGFAVAKRGWLFHGPGGTGKSSIIKQVIDEHIQDMKTLAILWPSDKIDAYEVKDFIKNFEYTGVEKLILVVEDLGGVEVDQVRIKSTASLLSLLDNVESTFTIPTAILATTNHPENFLGNITNRPQRFDTKVEVGEPSPEQRAEFLQFFTKNTAPEEVITEIKKKKYEGLTPAHIKEVIMRSELHEITLTESLQEIQTEINKYKKAFDGKKRSLGILDSDDY